MTQLKLETLINNHAASMTNPPKTYRSIEEGLAANKLRSDIVITLMAQGKDYAQAARMAQEEVVRVYGLPIKR